MRIRSPLGEHIEHLRLNGDGPVPLQQIAPIRIERIVFEEIEHRPRLAVQAQDILLCLHARIERSQVRSGLQAECRNPSFTAVC
jgi:hypothetical protein